MPAHSPEELHQLFAAGVNDKDVEALVELYEPDSVTVDLQGNRLDGEAALRAMLAGLCAGVDRLEGTTRRAIVHGDLALTSSAFHGTGTGPDGKPTALSGTSAEIARRQPDGTWRFVIDDPSFGHG
ncbi:SgcJ/EcaC family oxidoreductase [Actinomycetes bacterium KLBMP 9797]